MNKEFIPYEQALELKELGFDEPCFAAMDMYSNIDYGSEMYNWIKNSETVQSTWAALPLYQQAFRWFREKYQLYPNIVKSAKFGDWICEWQSFGGNFEVIGAYHHYEEAELACLKKLIDMVKGKEVSTQCNTFN